MISERLNMSIEKQYNQQINEAVQLETAGFTKEEILEMDKRRSEPSILWSDFMKELGHGN